MLLEQSNLSADKLREQIVNLLTDQDQLNGMRREMASLAKPDAAAALSGQLLEISAARALRQKHPAKNPV